jgi:hypothetical protein
LAKGASLVDSIIAYCGLVCSDCPAYLATQAEDWAALERMAVQAREEYGVPDATAESVLCDGCLGDSGHKCGYCAECAIRACALMREVVNCAHCNDYACEKLTSFPGFESGGRAVLDEVRRGLMASSS